MTFLCGILLVQQLPLLPPLSWSLVLIPLMALCWWRRALLPVLFFVGGMAWITLYAGIILQNILPQELEGKDLRLSGVIADLPKSSERGVRFKFNVLSAQLPDAKHVAKISNNVKLNIPETIQLTSYDPEFTPRVGDKWNFLVRLKRPYGFQNPGGFDYEGYLFHERIRATGYIRSNEPPRLINSDLSSRPIGRFRQNLSEGIRNALPENAFAGMITAFANGDETGIANNQWEVLQRTGTTHLIAISGMNIGLVAGIAFFLMRWLWALPGFTVLRFPAQKAAAISALAAAIAYAALAGFAIPTQRAMIMLAVVMGALLLNRRPRPSHLLATALLLVLLYDPLAVMSAGFWLSFAAIGVILLAIHGRVDETRRSQWGRIQCVIAIGMLPLMLAMFQQSSVSGPLANMLAIPVIEIIVIPVTLLGVFCLVILPQAVSTFLFQIAAWTMSKLWLALEYLAGLDQTLWVQHAPLGWALACALFGTLLLLAPRGWPARWLGIIWLLPMFLVRPAGPGPGELWFTLLDVGQGLAAVARTQHHTLVFDSGPRFSERFDTGRAVVAPYLRASGVDSIDTLIISHGDNDHIGGAESLIKAFPPNRILSSVPKRLPGGEHCIAGQTWRWDGVEFTVLNPQKITVQGNNASCVLLIKSTQGNVLLTGDIEAETEENLIRNWGTALHVQFLVVPHHGSKTSSTQAFIDTIDPQFALFPFGYKNRYRHPNQQVVERYRMHGTQLLDSPAQGAITIKLSARKPEITGYREAHKRYWFSQ
ncbi:MAG: DNA internalization-related competence protein ComEC/Rec2 [Gammaproteobacteria bacterium]